MTGRSSQSDVTIGPYTLTYRSMMGPIAIPEGAQYVTALRVDGKTRQALLQIVRLPHDMHGSVGLFSDHLSEAQSRAIPAAVDSISWGSLPPLTGGERNASMLRLEYSQGQRIVQRDFNGTNGEFIAAIRPIMSIVDGLVSTLRQKPLRAVDLSIMRTATGFKLIWRNVGVGPVMFDDPREPAQPGEPARGVARVRPKSSPGGFPVPWTPVPLAPSAPPFKPITLPPGGILELETVPWAAAPGEYAASASWIDYAGPAVREQDVMPRIPQMDELQDPRPFVIRGGAFAPGMRFVIENAR